MALHLKSTGIDFADISSGDLLDDYEEGTFTPVMKGGSTDGSNSYVSGTGTYTKIGGTCHIQLGFSNGTISSESGFLKVSGLPFTAASTNLQATATGRLHDFTWTADSFPVFYVAPDQTYLSGLESRRGGDWANWEVTNASTLYLNWGTTYHTT